MTRSQIVALALGTTAVVVGAGIAWHLHLMQAQAEHPLATASLAPAAPSNPAPAPSTSPATEGAGSPPASNVAPNMASSPKTMADALSLPPEEEIAPPAIDLAPILPQFDTVRVEPTGDAVVAGHGQPNAQVALLANGNQVADVESDGAGNFVIIPTPFAPGNYELTLRSARAGKLPRVSTQVVTVSVPLKGQKNLVVAVAEPGKPTKVLADAAAPAAPPAEAPAASAPVPAPTVAFRTSDVDKDGFYATGTATPPGEHLRIYLNGTHIADLSAAADGHWSLTVKRGLTPGHYVLRADALDAALAKVVARAEVAFDVPLLVAAATPYPPAPMPPAAMDAPAPSPAPSPAAPPQSPAAPRAPAPVQQASSEMPAPSATTNDAVVPNVSTATVTHGDSLWRISRKIFGLGIRYTLIYEANASQIRNPNLIYPGQIFVVPPKK